MLLPIAPLLRAGCLDSRTALVISCESFLCRRLPPQLVSNIFLLFLNRKPEQYGKGFG